MLKPETRRGRPVFAQDPDTHRWVLACDPVAHTGFVDASLSASYAKAVREALPSCRRFGQRQSAIEAGLLTGYLNSWSEGYNRLANTKAATPLGSATQSINARRIRWSCIRQHRRTSAARSTLPA